MNLAFAKRYSSCTFAQLHICTFAHLQWCAIAHLHIYRGLHLLICAFTQVCSCTFAHLHTFRAVQLHICTVAQLHRCAFAALSLTLIHSPPGLSTLCAFQPTHCKVLHSILHYFSWNLHCALKFSAKFTRDFLYLDIWTFCIGKSYV